MDPNLDLPQLVSSLCFQVNHSSHHTFGRMLSEHMFCQVSYAHVGCAGFMPNVKSPMTGLEERPTQIMQTPCPSPLQWNTVRDLVFNHCPYVDADRQ